MTRCAKINPVGLRNAACEWIRTYMFFESGLGTLVGANSFALQRYNVKVQRRLLWKKIPSPPGFQDMLSFNLIEGLLGRRSQRFFMGAEIPDGVFKYKSRQKPLPLSELEKMLVVSACRGNTLIRPGSWSAFQGLRDPSSPIYLRHFWKISRHGPSIYLIMYLQAHYLDLEFYDRFYKPGAYLKTHAMHMVKWHAED